MRLAGTPIPYEALRTYFKSDPASSWGAYVAGCLLVLAHEKGTTFPDGISVLIASDVPEGGCSVTASKCSLPVTALTLSCVHVVLAKPSFVKLPQQAVSGQKLLCGWCSCRQGCVFFSCS